MRFFRFLAFFTLLILPIFLNAQTVLTNGQAYQTYNEALFLIGSRDYVRARRVLIQLVNQSPDMAEAYLKIAVLFKKTHEPDEGRAFFKRLLAGNPKNAFAYHALGWIYFDKKGYKKAAELDWQAVQLKPDCAGCFKDYLDAMKKQGRLAAAAKNLEKWQRAHPKNAAVYFAFGYLGQLQKTWQKSLVNLKKALELGADLPDAYVTKDVVCFYAGRYREMLKTSQSGLARAKKKNDLEFQCRFLGDAGLAYASLSKYAQALNDLNRALALARKIGSEAETIRNFSNIGMVYQNSGKTTKALIYFKKALALATQANNRRQVGFLLRNIGSVYRFRDEYAKALSYFKRSLPILNESGNQRMVGLVYWSMSLTHWDFGNYTRALELAKMAAAVADSIGDRWGQERYGGTVGLIYWNLGNYTEAFARYEKALALAREIGDREGEKLWFGNMAVLFSELGDWPKSLNYYDRARAIAAEIGNRGEEARLIGEQGAVYWQENDMEKALHFYKEALKIEQDVGNKKEQASFLDQMAGLYFERGQLKISKTYTERALKLARRIGARGMEGNSYLQLGNQDAKRGKELQALGNYKKALRIGEILKDEKLVWRANAGLARLYSQKRQFEKSLHYYEKAIDGIEKIWGTVPTEKYKAGFLESKLDVYGEAIHLLNDLHRQFPSKGYDRQAFQLSERARARSLLQMVTEGRVFHFLKGIPPAFRVKFLMNEKQLKNAYQMWSREWSKPEGERNHPLLSKLTNEIDSLKRAKSQLTHALRKAHPDYYRLTDPTLLTVRDVQTKILSDKTVLIEYWVGKDKIYLWAIRKNSFLFKAIDLSRGVLQKRLVEISPLFASKKAAKGVLTDHRWADINFEQLNALYGDLLEKPAGKFLENANRIIIIPDGRLFYLPFEMLVTKIEGNSPHYLIEDFPISYASSASLLNPDLKKTKQAPKDLLAFGNPDYSRKGETITSLSSLARYRSILRQDRFQALPNAEREVRAIARNFRKAAVFTGKRATESRFKRLAGGYRLIHLATHFVIDDVHPMHSKIILAQSPDKTDDGDLEMHEVYNLRLKAEMVVLSGCNSGLGTWRRGEGLIGLTRAFLYAGVPNVVVSLWPVEDRSTAWLMKNFYAHLKQGLDKAQALQKAKIDLIQSKDKARDSFYWAPFILIED